MVERLQKKVVIAICGRVTINNTHSLLNNIFGETWPVLQSNCWEWLNSSLSDGHVVIDKQMVCTGDLVIKMPDGKIRVFKPQQ